MDWKKKIREIIDNNFDTLRNEECTQEIVEISYPKEFVRWKDENYYYSLGVYFEKSDLTKTVFEASRFNSLDELFHYYETEVTK